MSIERGNWVRPRNGPPEQRGFVTAVKAYQACVRYVGTGKGEWIGKNQLREATAPRLLLLEGSLDGELHSTRSERNALANWCDANGIRLAHKNIHHLEDLEVIAKSIGNREPPFIHLSCHGDFDSQKRAYITFAPKPADKDRLRLNDEQVQKAFRVFSGRALLLSACSVGRDKDAITGFKRGAQLSSVAAFCREIHDDEAILFDLAAYHAAINLGLNFKTAIERARKTVGVLGIVGDPGQQFVRVV